MVNGELAVVYEDEIQCTRPEDNFQTRHSTQRSTRSKGATLKQSQQNLPDIPFNLIPPSLLRTNQSKYEKLSSILRPFKPHMLREIIR